jgi:hypothetical protein
MGHMRRVWAGLVITSCAVALVAGTLPAGAAPRARVSGPKWDLKIAPIAAEVEQLRGLNFDHAVPVHYLDDKAFQKRLLGPDKSPSSTQSKALKQTEDQLRAFGLVDKGFDLHASSRKAMGAGTLAFYDPRDQQVFVRGHDTTAPATRVTLAHELTHALQDQHFNLLKLQAEAFADKNLPIVKAIIEGDATYVQNAFAAKMSAEQRKAYEATKSDESAQAEKLDVPEIIKVELGVPYALGEGLIATMRAAKGHTAEDDLFRNVPSSDLPLIDPTTALAHTKVDTVPVPKLAAGDKQVGVPDRLGAVDLFVVLASRLPAVDAMRAAELWRGDRTITFERKGLPCATVDVVGADSSATAKIRATLQQWTAAAGGATAVNAASGHYAELSTCAPAGPVTPIPSGTLIDASRLLSERNAFVGGLMKTFGSATKARCVANELIGNATVRGVLEQVDHGELSAADGQAQLGEAIAGSRDEILTSCA